MKTLISFRTEESHKQAIVQKSSELGITVSELLDTILANYNGDDISSDTNPYEGKYIETFYRLLYLRRMIIKLQRKVLEIRSTEDDPDSREMLVMDLLDLIDEIFLKQRDMSAKKIF